MAFDFKFAPVCLIHMAVRSVEGQHSGIMRDGGWMQVVGIMHTNYAELSRRTVPGPLGIAIGFVSRVMNACLCAMHTHKVRLACSSHHTGCRYHPLVSVIAFVTIRSKLSACSAMVWSRPVCVWNGTWVDYERMLVNWTWC